MKDRQRAGEQGGTSAAADDGGQEQTTRWLAGGRPSGGDAIDQRIATLLARLPEPDPLPAARLAAVRAEVAARAGGRAAARLRTWTSTWALALLLLLLGSGVVAAARGWLPVWPLRREAGSSGGEAPSPSPAPERSRARAVRSSGASDGVPVNPPAPPPPQEAPPAVAAPAPALAPPPNAAAPRARVAVAAAPPPGSEAALLESAIVALRQKRDPQQALRLLDRHQARFAGGLLGEEAARVRVDALLVAGQTRAARRLLDGLTLSTGARDVELRVIRGELRAADGDCRGAAADFAGVPSLTADPALLARARQGDGACSPAAAPSRQP